LILNSAVNNINEPEYVSSPIFKRNNDYEKNLNATFISENSNHLNENEGGVVSKGGVIEVDGMMVSNELSSQKVNSGGPIHSTNTHHANTGGVRRRRAQSENLGCFNKSNNPRDGTSGNIGLQRRDVYSEGPRAVYDKLNSGPHVLNLTQNLIPTKKQERNLILFLNE
jgi:hypothetical protein